MQHRRYPDPDPELDLDFEPEDRLPALTLWIGTVLTAVGFGGALIAVAMG